MPPNSQGYLTLAGAWIAEGLQLYEPADARWAHALIEAAAAARRDRDVLLHDRADGPALLARSRLADRRARVEPAPAAGPRAAPAAVDTVCLAPSTATAWASS